VRMSVGNGLEPLRNTKQNQSLTSPLPSIAPKVRPLLVLLFGSQGAIQVSTGSSAKTLANASVVTQSTLQLES